MSPGGSTAMAPERATAAWARARRSSTAVLIALCVAILGAGCQSIPDAELPLAEEVDLQRFSGDWYVIGGILTPFEDGAHDAVESYEFVEPNVMETTFAFRRGGFDGEPVRYTPRGFVRPDTGNAVWGMQFVWPFRLDYRIVHLEPDYSVTIIGRRARDFVWIMAREPTLSDAQWQALRDRVVSFGYDADAIRRVPQSGARGAP